MSKLRKTLILATTGLAALGVATSAVLAQGMMGQGQGTGPGMMGLGMMGPGMSGQGMGPGMMGPGMQQMPGMPGQGMGMMGQGMPGMMGGQGMPDMMGGQGPGMRVTPSAHLTTDDFSHFLGHFLERHNNPRLKVGAVQEVDEDTIVAEIVTVDDSLVQRFRVDRHTGQMVPDSPGQAQAPD